jgi:hypothetical protein
MKIGLFVGFIRKQSFYADIFGESNLHNYRSLTKYGLNYITEALNEIFL